MNKEELRLKDSVLYLKLKKETLKCLEYFEIYTIGELLNSANELRNNVNGIVFEDIMTALNSHGLKIDAKLGEHSKELRERNEERNRIIIELNSRLPENIDDFLNSNLSILEIPKKAEDILNKLGIQTVEDLMRFNPIELQEYTRLASPLIIKIQESLNKYGLEMGKDYHDRKELEIYQENIEEIHQSEDQVIDNSEEKEEVEMQTTAESQEQNENTANETIQKRTPRSKIDRDRWLRRFSILRFFYAYHNHIFIKKGSYRVDGVDLGEWLCTQRKLYKKNMLPNDLVQLLESIDMVWDLGTRDGQELKNYYLTRNNIRNIICKNNEIITFYKDGTKRSTNDEEFKNAIMAEGFIDSDEGIEKNESETIQPSQEETIQPDQRLSQDKNAQEEIEVLNIERNLSEEETTSETVVTDTNQDEESKTQSDSKQGIEDFLQALRNRKQFLEQEYARNKELALKKVRERQEQLLKEKNEIEDEIRNLIDNNIEILCQDSSILNSINGVNTFLQSSVFIPSEQSEDSIEERIKAIQEQNGIIEKNIEEENKIKSQISELVSTISSLMAKNSTIKKEVNDFDDPGEPSGIHF